MLRATGTANVNPLNGVQFGQEKTREDYLARSAWEYDQASRLRAARHPVGYQALAEGHERTAREYERGAEGRPSVPHHEPSLRTPLQEKMRRKPQRGRRAHSTKALSFRVDIENQPRRVFNSAAKALTHGARHVYLSSSQAEKMLERLVRGEPVAWSYGFTSVDISPVP